MGFTLCKTEQLLLSIELREKEVQKDLSMQKICLDRTTVKSRLLILDLRSFRSLVIPRGHDLSEFKPKIFV